MKQKQFTDIEFLAKVRRMAKDESMEPIDNGLPEHAAILYHIFFENAEKTVKIFCKNLGPEVFVDYFDKLRDSMMKALNKKAHVSVITQDEPSPDNVFYKHLLDLKSNTEYGSLVSIETVPNVDNESFSGLKKINQNFCVVDKKAYRFEGDSMIVKAVAYMNMPELAEQLDDLFIDFQNKIKEPILAQHG